MKISFLLKQADTDPGTASIIAAGLGGGIGALLDLYDESQGKVVENQWRRPLLGAITAGLPFLTYNLARGSFDRDAEGNRTLSSIARYFSTDKDYWKHDSINQSYADYIASKRKYYPDNAMVEKRSWVTNIRPIPVNSFNQTTWVDASRGRTPLEAAGLITDTLEQTQQRVGSGFVTPGQVMTTMVNAGIGYGTAWLAGKALGALANVSPATQKKLCEIGTWGGMLGGISNAMQRY